jgi:hypothetical protein
MSDRFPENADLDNFYSAESRQEWQQIIGADLHYHFGYFLGSEDLETGLKQTVRNFYPYIPRSSRVLDIGCGWGGPAKMLVEECGCSVEGITIGTEQAKYCQSIGLNVRCQDIERDEVNENYDVLFLLEFLSHIREKADLLSRLRLLAPRLILSVNCVADNYWGERITFGKSMEFCTVSELIHHVESAGWKIKWMQDRRFYSLRTFPLWKQNLDRIYGDQQPPGQLGILRSHIDAALRDPVKWSLSFPLIDIVAD